MDVGTWGGGPGGKLQASRAAVSDSRFNSSTHSWSPGSVSPASYARVMHVGKHLRKRFKPVPPNGIITLLKLKKGLICQKSDANLGTHKVLWCFRQKRFQDTHTVHQHMEKNYNNTSQRSQKKQKYMERRLTEGQSSRFSRQKETEELWEKDTAEQKMKSK